MDLESELSTSTAAFVSKSESTKNTTTSSFEGCSTTGQSALTLDCLPEDVLLELFSYLNSSDLSNLCAFSSRIGQICQDRQLWRKIRVCCDGFKPHHDPLLSVFSDSNTRIKVSCKKKVMYSQVKNQIVSRCLGRDFFRKLKNSTNLEIFILKNHCFSMATFSLDYFPASLTELKLNGCFIFRSSKLKTIFANMHKQLPNLQILDLSRCYWLELSALKGIFKCPKIETLNLVGCEQLDMTSAIMDLDGSPILSSLEIIDARKTSYDLGVTVNWPVDSKRRSVRLDLVPAVNVELFALDDDDDVESKSDWLDCIELLISRREHLNLKDALMKLRTGASP